MIEDSELLRRYAEDRSEDAFAELVRRHLNLVYSAAIRQVGSDVQTAEDVTQNVFVDLARKAASLSRRPVLTAWLYTSAHFAAAKALRTGQRRQTREQEAQVMQELLQDSAPELDWAKLRSVLDDVMHELKESDREAILLRYFENRPLAEVGGRLGLNENAARMRVERALDKLRVLLAGRGINSGVSALAIAIVNQSVSAAPFGLGTKIIAAAVASTAIGSGLGFTLMNIMTTGKIKAATAVVLVAAGATTAMYFKHEANSLRTDLAKSAEQSAATSAELERIQEENRRLHRIEVAADELARLRNEHSELVRLRGEVGILRGLAAELEKLRAANQQNQNVVQAVANPVDSAPKLTGRTIYELARQNQVASLKSMLSLRPELISEGSGPFSSTPLHTAAYHRHMEILAELLRLKANINAQNEMGFTPVHDAITGDGQPGGPEVVDILIKSGADLTIRNLAGQTPLAYAVEKDQREIVELLRHAGAKE